MAEDNQADYGINAPESRTYIWRGSTFASTFPDRTAARDAHFCLPHLRPSMRVLDCGCGPGSITVGLADAVRPGEVVGIDMQAAEIARARALAGNLTVENVRFEVASVYQLPFDDASFDAVFAHGVLMHLHDPVRALREMRRVLRPAGIVGIRDFELVGVKTPSTPVLERIDELWRRTLEHRGINPVFARHQRWALCQAGFARTEALVDIRYAGSAEGTQRAAAQMLDRFQHALVPTALEQGWITEGEGAALCAELLAWGERPDALAYGCGSSALAWLEDDGH